VCRLAGGDRLDSLPGWKLIRDLIRAVQTELTLSPEMAYPCLSNLQSVSPVCQSRHESPVCQSRHEFPVSTSHRSCPASLAKAELSSRLERTRISCHATLDMAACAAFRKESRMKFANTNNLDRNPG
jgi:hypothetical protein